MAVALEGVSVVPYGVRDCAAGALAEVLAYWGDRVAVDELDARLPKARNGGVLSVDLLLEARSRGFDAELAEGSPAELADSIGRGEPAILLVRVLNAPRSRADLYHYVVVDGHDPSRGLLRLHFGDGVKRWVEAARLERAWAPTGHLILRLRPEPGWEPR